MSSVKALEIKRSWSITDIDSINWANQCISYPRSYKSNRLREFRPLDFLTSRAGFRRRWQTPRAMHKRNGSTAPI
ncbi:hypothetical protein HZ326_18971 [Fusarium oxysporum f. sp. albedinis]|nr:hypothetical protein HZ326_18971 [Fusarium oxysporum f. sp. albedinis]